MLGSCLHVSLIRISHPQLLRGRSEEKTPHYPTNRSVTLFRQQQLLYLSFSDSSCCSAFTLLATTRKITTNLISFGLEQRTGTCRVLHVRSSHRKYAHDFWMNLILWKGLLFSEKNHMSVSLLTQSAPLRLFFFFFLLLSRICESSSKQHQSVCCE